MSFLFQFVEETPVPLEGRDADEWISWGPYYVEIPQRLGTVHAIKKDVLTDPRFGASA